MRFIVLLFFLGSVSCGFSQNVIVIERPKEGYWITYGKDRPQSGIAPDGKVEEGFYVNDRKEGEFIKYHKDGRTPKLIGTYVNNRPYGNYKKFYESGNLKETGLFLRNRHKDTLKRFYENGQLEYIAYFDSLGKENGWVTYFYDDGSIEFTYFAEHGTVKDELHLKPNGDTIYFGKGFRPICSVSKKEPRIETNKTKQAPKLTLPPLTRGLPWRPDGYNKVFNSNQEIWQDGIFKEGQLWDGKVYVYDKDGIVLWVEIYKNGMYHSDGQLF